MSSLCDFAFLSFGVVCQRFDADENDFFASNLLEEMFASVLCIVLDIVVLAGMLFFKFGADTRI